MERGPNKEGEGRIERKRGTRISQVPHGDKEMEAPKILRAAGRGKKRSNGGGGPGGERMGTRGGAFDTDQDGVRKGEKKKLRKPCAGKSLRREGVLG